MVRIKITQQQYDAINNTLIAESWFCNPVQDINGNWFVSMQEAQALNIEGEEAEYVAPIYEDL